MNSQQKKILKWGIGLALILILVVGAVLYNNGDSKKLETQEAGTGVSEVSKGELTDTDKATLDKEREMGAASDIGLSDARQVAIAWSYNWGQGSIFASSGKSQKDWLESMRKYTTDTLLTRMDSIDMINVPNTGKVENAAEVKGTNRVSAVNFLVTYATGLTMEVSVQKQPDDSWKVGTYGKIK